MTTQPPVSTLVEAFERLARETTRGITFIRSAGQESFYTYSDFANEVKYCLFNLFAAGVRAGDEVMIQLEDNQHFLTVFWACILGGMVPVPLATGNQEEQKKKPLKVWEQLSRPWLFATQHTREEISNNPA